VNLTDGLDGLATGCVIAASLPYVILAYVVGRTDFSRFLLIDYVPGCGELTVFVAATVGASMAFLWFNSHPAEVFMGDTGSLALGGALGITAVLVKQEMLLPIIGGVFVAEALSVMIQVVAVRRFKKRVFLMSPIHHHFEMKGWAEAKIITRFWIISALLGIFGLATLKMR
jgi:phospho-N-acetylmuramoyl-pentapeptide-transferase